MSDQNQTDWSQKCFSDDLAVVVEAITNGKLRIDPESPNAANRILEFLHAHYGEKILSTEGCEQESYTRKQQEVGKLLKSRGTFDCSEPPADFDDDPEDFEDDPDYDDAVASAPSHLIANVCPYWQTEKDNFVLLFSTPKCLGYFEGDTLNEFDLQVLRCLINLLQSKKTFSAFSLWAEPHFNSAYRK
ncbi:MAG: hypothetical protein Q4E62_03945 [Sutterellaceae bacterium]|nr:hypothetical protein [Sutterellaceae bacterium]